MAAPAAPAAAPAQRSEDKAVVMANPFTKASTKKSETFADITQALDAASSRRLPQLDVPATGYLRHVWLLVDITAPAGGTLAADAPWNLFDSIVFTDVNGQSLVELSGYELFLMNLFGGITQNSDPRRHSTYSNVVTAVSFALRIPLEIIQRNALGALPNLNSAMTYKVKLVAAPISTIYSVVPGAGAVTARIRLVAESWANPQPADLRGVPNMQTPPALGTTRNLTSEIKPVANGANTQRFSRVGNTIRNHILVTRDGSGVRSSGILPLEVLLLKDGNQLHRSPLAYMVHRMCELYDILPADIPAGVYVWPYTDDFDGTPGEEAGDYWLQTTGATRLEMQGTFRAAGSLAILTDDILAFQSNANSGAGATLGAQA